ncbi:hypothetical protein KQX54_011211 [Cotesia glomerata]|uniref:Uncharacterized protein n=1 Tax=Cotesia glomerata TaxID=32391 RepID=A0AAV7IMU5_COTGL|nr:hypothetical protein KQX54_011211 [Cotesia glomerata]
MNMNESQSKGRQLYEDDDERKNKNNNKSKTKKEEPEPNVQRNSSKSNKDSKSKSFRLFYLCATRKLSSSKNDPEARAAHPQMTPFLLACSGFARPNHRGYAQAQPRLIFYYFIAKFPLSLLTIRVFCSRWIIKKKKTNCTFHNIFDLILILIVPVIRISSAYFTEGMSKLMLLFPFRVFGSSIPVSLLSSHLGGLQTTERRSANVEVEIHPRLLLCISSR